MRTYIDLLEQILIDGEDRGDRTGTGTRSLFGLHAEFSMEERFPLVTTKKVFFDSVVAELLWFLKGSTNVNDLDANFWDAWADEDGEVGPVYGAQWRNWGGYNGEQGIDQLLGVIEGLATNPEGRRHIVSAWNVSELASMRLPPCPCFFQFYVRKGTHLDIHLYQRSADMMIGVPFDIASYCLLNMMVAQEVGLLPGVFYYALGDAHIYQNHLEAAREQVKREPRALPIVGLNPDKSMFDMTRKDIILADYNPHPHIKLPVAV